MKVTWIAAIFAACTLVASSQAMAQRDGWDNDRAPTGKQAGPSGRGGAPAKGGGNGSMDTSRSNGDDSLSGGNCCSSDRLND